MTFDLWLFENLGQTMDAARMVYDNMPTSEQQEEYSQTTVA